MCTLSRLAEDIIIYSNPLFGFITLHDRYSTGVQPDATEERNADPMELVRGKAGRLIGHLSGLLTTLKGLPSTYNKDLQEDKESLFDTIDTVRKLLPVMTAIIRTLQINPDKMRAALTEELLATDLADYLVKKGMPFRQAHHIVGQVVQLAQQQEVALSQVSLLDLRQLSDLFDDDVQTVFDFDARCRPAGRPQAVPHQPLWKSKSNQRRHGWNHASRASLCNCNSLWLLICMNFCQSSGKSNSVS